MASEIGSMISYYARTGYYRHLQTICTGELKKRGGDPTLHFWRALGMLQEGSINEAIREYEAVGSMPGGVQLALPVKLALLYAHRASRVVDREDVERLEQEIELVEPRATEQACLLAAQFLWHLGEVAQSREHASRLIELQPQSAAGLSLLGWLDLDDAEANGHGLEEDLLSAAAGGFERALKASPRSLDALVGLARMRTASQQYQEALDRLQQAIAAHPWFFPAHVEKCDVLVAMGDWEQAVEVAEAVLAKEPAAIEARRIKILYLLVHRSSYGAAAEQICELVELLDRHEPQNAPLFCRVARSFARLSGRNAGVLQHTRALMERACTLAPASCAFAAELGYQQMLSGNLRDAHQTLKQASTLEAASTDVVLHQIKCLVLLGQTEDAEQQLEFVSATMLERTPEMALCEALLARGWGGTAQALSLLDEAFELQMQAVRDAAPGERYLTQLCPDRLLEIAREFMRHCPSEPEVLDSGSVASNALAKATRLLELVTRKVPGLLEGQMLLAQARFLLGDFEAASRTCSYCVAADPSYVAASLLHARVLSLQGKLSRADGVLEQALAHNFGIRDSPQYALIKGKVLQSQGDLPAAASLLETAMAAAARPARRGGQASGSDQATPQSRCDVYLQLAEVYLALDRRKDAKRLAREAAAEFAGGPEEGRMSLATARLELKSGNVEKAIQMLCGISSASPQFLAAQKDLALLYLNHRGDRHKYAQCHLELVKANPSAASYVMLGEAYMHISEPREALAAFEQALQADPSNSALSSRIGKVLVTTLQYARAVEYYEGAVQRDPSQSRLRHELAELCLRLKKHDRAESELLELLAQLGDGAADLGDATQRVEALRLLAKVHQERGGADEAINELLKASEAQQGVLARVRVDAPDLTGEQGRVAADVACQLGELYELKHNGESAIASHEAALRHCSGHERSSLALARLRMLRGELESAEVLCVSLLRVDPGHQDAVMALADVMQQRSEWGAAVDHLRSHLETRHADFRSIAKLLQVLRRAGRLEEADAFLNRAERSSPHAAQHAGFRLCKGLLTLYRNNPRSALQFLNLVRNDAEWGPDAAQAMIEIYLDPDRETNWDELELASSPQPSDAVRACERLLRELPRSQRQQVLDCYTLMAYRTQTHLEKAASMLLELLGADRECVPAMVCLSQCYLMLKQAPKARNHLKRVAKMPFVAELAEDFERGWLMLADVYIASGKYDLAEELCRRCLASNNACAKAWEFLGVVKEKEMSYLDAATHYEQAWKHGSEASAEVGHKLSFNYLKAKKFVEAIDVCHKVLRQYPDYTRIRHEVLERARESVRL